MPKTTRQRRGEVIASLRHTPLISQERLEEALADAGIESPTAVKQYAKKLEDLGDLVRVPGGFQLSPASRRSHTITVKISPSQATSDVRKAITAALLPFGRIATMEEEL